MRTLYAYLLKEFALTVLMTVMVFCLILLLGNVVRQVLALLVAGNASLAALVKAVLYLIPYLFTYALPFGVVAGALLAFGRLSADNELTAARAGGVSLASLILPVVALSVGLAILSAAINLQVAPRAKTAYKDLQRSLLQRAGTDLLVERRFNSFHSFDIYVERKEENRLYGVTIQKREDGRFAQYIKAEEARLTLDPEEGVGRIELSEVIVMEVTDQGARVMQWREYPHDFELPRRKARRRKLNELTFGELIEEKKEVERRLRAAGDSRLGALEIERFTMPIKVQIHTHLALSFACVAFTLLGAPLGIRAHRRETSAGLAMAIGLVAVYYTFIVVGKSLSDRPEFGPQYIVWLPNFAFQALGLALLRRADRAR